MFKRLVQLLVIAVLIAVVANYKEILKSFYPAHYEETVIKYSKQYKLDPYLIFSLIKVESKFNPYAKSNKNAIGLMQITPNTGNYIAKLIGDKNFSTDMLYNPEINIKYGCFYISKLFNDFDGNIDCILAAYNGGEGNVRKWLKYGEDGKYINVDQLPFDETRKYIQKVKRNYRIYTFLYTKSDLLNIMK